MSILEQPDAGLLLWALGLGALALFTKAVIRYWDNAVCRRDKAFQKAAPLCKE